MSAQRVTAETDLPEGLDAVETLSVSDRGAVLRVRRDGDDLVLRVGEEADGDFALEISLGARLNDPALVPPLEWGRTPGGRPFLLRRFVEGRPFDEAAPDATAQQVEAWVRALLASLGALHEAGLVHRDIKGPNVLVGEGGPVLVDLDLMAGAEGADGAGSALHIAPEVLLGHPVTPAADLFSVGVMVALALCGPAAADFHLRFPRVSFWEAAGLDPASLHGELGSLVRQLVRRHPADRPVSAREAALRLQGGGDLLPPLRLPFLAGREGALRRLVTDLEAPRGERHVGLVAVSDEEDVAPLLENLELAVTLAGRSARREALEDPLEPCLAELLRKDTDTLLVDGVETAEAQGVQALVDLVAAFLAAPVGDGHTLVLAAGGTLGQEVMTRLRQRNLDEVVARIQLLNWARVPVAALGRHLDQLSAGSSPDAAQSLGRELGELTRGRLGDVNRVLEQAVELGVLRPDDGSYTILRGDWPERAAPSADLQLDHDWGLGALAVLHGLAVAAWAPTAAECRELTGLDEDALAGAVATLRDAGVLRGLRDESSPLLVTDKRWLAAARRELDEAATLALHERCLALLADGDNRRAARASHRLALAGRGEHTLGEVLADVEELLGGGRHGSARRLTQKLSERAGELDGPALERLRILEARLELAQGAAGGALDLLTRAYGEELDGTSCALLLVAAHAAEQAGRRDDARRLNALVLERSPDREEELRATVGLAYGDLLGGDAQGTLDRLEGVPAEGDPLEPTATLFSLRGASLTSLGRLDDAAAAYDEALRLGTEADAPLLIARVELNRAQLDRRRGRPSEAVAGLERAAKAFDRAGHVQGRALALNNLGVLQRDRGELVLSRELLSEALALRRRVGDLHGAGSSLGSLAVAQLEAGQVGVALDAFARAAELFSEGGYENELAFVEVQQAVALALVGRQGQAAGLLAAERAGRARASHPALVARAEALVHLATDQRQRAVESLEGAMAAAREAGDAAEQFRAGALLLSLQPGDPEVLGRVENAADLLDAPVRRREAVWRGRGPDAPADRAELEAFLETFQAAGRTDLVRAVATLLADACDAEGDQNARRSATARAAEAADALTDGLTGSERERTLERLARMSGPRPRHLARGDGLGLDWLLSCNRRMATEEDLDGLLLSIVDMALELTGARRGFLVLLAEGEREQVDVQVARNMDQEDMAPEEARFSRTVVNAVLRDGQGVVTTDAAGDERFAGAMSIASLNVRSVLCVPVPSIEGVCGALYLDDDTPRSTLDETDVERVSALADQAGVAIGEQRRRAEIVRLNEQLSQRVEYQDQELEKTRKALKRRGDVAPVGGLVGDSEAMGRVYALMDRVAPTDLAVLVTGPSGTGKDVAARALHARSNRATGPLIIENVAAVPASLLESELFGHVRGAFTGADRDRKGLFAEADGGTFVLDEIGELPMELQPKLLRVLEAGEVRPVGSRKTLKIDVRIVAATNRDLLERVREGEFREDLYYRLNAVEVRMPPLAERLDDIPLLAQHFLDLLNDKHATDKRMEDEVLTALMRRPWPGQVRELSNEMSRLYFLSDEVIDNGALVRPAAGTDRAADGDAALPADSLRLEDAERVAILRALKAAGGRKEQAAKLLGISRAGLYAKIRRLEIEPEETEG